LSIQKQENGFWIVNCPICGWKKSFHTQIGAKRKLSNHINVQHQEGRKKKIKGPPSRAVKDMPPQLPQDIKEAKY
jgi:predicted nucleic-acid-binding Zn-ribbon protein